MPRALTFRAAAALIVASGAVTIGGALASEHLFGLLPCRLCLWQRTPYYIGVPLAVVLALAAMPDGWRRTGFAFLGLIFAVSAGLGAYHAGVEWGVFAGPADCGATPTTPPGQMSDFLRSLETVRVVSCTEAAWRFAGLSLAGWNALVSAALAATAALAALRAPVTDRG